MRKPDMILFDYGHTLVYEPAFDTISGCEAVLRMCIENPLAISAETLSARMAESFRRYQKLSQDLDIDFMDVCASRLVYETLELRFSCDLLELERIYWDAAGPAHPMSGVPEMLEELKSRGIRTGVVSNMNFRESNLRARIDRLLPGHEFEFILASCEYATRKPRRDFFDLALSKAKLTPDRVWFVGDNPRCDILGASEAGIFPVLYSSEEYCPYRSDRDRKEADCAGLHISDWQTLLMTIDGAV